MYTGMDTLDYASPSDDIIAVGDYERAIAGADGSCFSGRGGTSITGDDGHSVAGDDGFAITGAGGCASAGAGGVASAGVGGSVRAGLGGVVSLSGRDGEREFTVIASVNPDRGPLPGVYYRLRGHALSPLASEEYLGEVAAS